MRFRRFPILFAVLACLLMGAQSAGAATAVPPLAAKLTDCNTGADAASRSAAFQASMPDWGTASVLRVHFTLERRVGPDDDWDEVSLPAWRDWESSSPGASGFVYSKKVVKLTPNFDYRADVDYRWVDKTGKVVRKAERLTKACTQPELRPDLGAAQITITPLPEGGATYAVAVLNGGRSDALGPFSVSLSVGGATVATLSVPTLASDDHTTVVFDGPACPPGQTVRVLVDSDDDIDEANETNNALTSGCPIPPPPAPAAG